MKSDLSGRRFGMLTVLRCVGQNAKNRQYIWECKCDCGQMTKVLTGNLTAGKGTRSCGCQKGKRNSSKLYINNRALYRRWQNMKARCKYLNRDNSIHYSKRGIKVCAEWESFENFMIWAKSHGFDNSRQLDRIDNNGDYEPSNCRWVSAKENSNNRSNNKSATINGITRTYSEWAEIINITYSAFKGRVDRGWKENELLLGKRQRKRIWTP